jgi:methylase of polypeptide subunit release factors
MPGSEDANRLLGAEKIGPVRHALGRVLGVAHRVAGSRRYDDARFERVAGARLLIAPTVFNPRVLRTGAFFARTIARHRLGAGLEVLDLGTGSGICAIVAARLARQVVAVDINEAAVRCAAVNAALNGAEARIRFRQGDLFAPVAGDRFDVVFFNPPFARGAASGERDGAWRSPDMAERFAAGLAACLAPGGRAYLLLSTWGGACGLFLDELARRGYALRVFAVRRYLNERVTVFEVAARADA